MKYTVWLFTRPLSYATLFPPLAVISNGKEHFCHWGVLVSDMTLLDGQAILLRKIEYGGNDKTDLGTMYDLFREKDGHINVNINRPFTMAIIKREWRWLSVQYVGETHMTYEMIKDESEFPKHISLLS